MAAPRFTPDASLANPSSWSQAQFSEQALKSATNSPIISTNDAKSPQQHLVPQATVACLVCRERHLKCDGLIPCSRCVSSSSECLYIASRRGRRGPRKVLHGKFDKSQITSPRPRSSSGDNPSFPLSPSTVSNAAQITLGLAPNTVLVDAPTPETVTSTASTTDPPLPRAPLIPVSNGAQIDAIQTGLHQTASFEDRYFDAFYHYFHQGHPFVLPREYFLIAMQQNSFNINTVTAAMRYIGSLYNYREFVSDRLLEDAIHLCYSPSTPKDGFLLQALLLLVIGLDGSCQQDRARHLLVDCERLAIQINLNTRYFASIHGHGNPVLEESWRRTWWELYVCDGMIAGVHQVTTFPLFDAPADVGLPCEEHQYTSGDISPSLYLEDLDDALFSRERHEFSSFAYRIAAAKNLGRLIRMPKNVFPGDENVVKIETHLTNWAMHLPASKRDCLNQHHKPDEMMFQAHFIIHACTIMLHQPFSQLNSLPTRAVTSCSPHRELPSGQLFNTHTKHTLDAARTVGHMITQPVPVLSHTHFFICVITLSSIVHLSNWASYFIEDEEDLRQLIRINIGALKTLSEVWKAASTACEQVQGVAQEIYHEKKKQQIAPAFWAGLTQEQITSNINVDETIMSDLTDMLHPAT
ncbi:hypothetical protein BX600DRAFT_482961 [Xylariales sp. PMI_506]|nr:hypothetical protein BX600DRAFT_482961 [Xylariales sp. PMI_506]